MSALYSGGSVSAVCRWTKARVQQMLDDEEIITDLEGDDVAETLVENRRGEDGTTRDTDKKLADAFGMRAGGKVLIAIRTWAYIKVQKERRLVLAYFHLGGEEPILGCKLCPYWNYKPDYISLPVKKVPGVAKGMAPTSPCAGRRGAVFGLWPGHDWGAGRAAALAAQALARCGGDAGGAGRPGRGAGADGAGAGHCIVGGGLRGDCTLWGGRWADEPGAAGAGDRGNGRAGARAGAGREPVAAIVSESCGAAGSGAAI